MDQGSTPFFNRLDEYRNTPKPPSDWRIPEPDENGVTPASPAELEQNGLEMRSAYSRVGLGLFLYVLIPQLLAVGFSFIGSLFFPALLEEAWFQLVISDTFMYLIGAPVCLLAMGMPKRKSTVTREKLPIGVFFVAICVFEAGSIGGGLLGNGLMGLFSLLTGHDYDSAVDTMINGLSLPLIFLFVVVIGPIMEEIIFRRAPLERLLPYGEFRAVLLTSIVFGLAHGNFFQFFYCVAGGMVLGYLYARTRRIVYPAALHMIFNFMGGFLPVMIERAAGISDTAEITVENLLAIIPLLLYQLLMYGLALAGVILFCLFFRSVKFRPAEIALPKEHMFKRTWLNGGMIALSVVLLILLLLSLIPM